MDRCMVAQTVAHRDLGGSAHHTRPCMRVNPRERFASGTYLRQLLRLLASPVVKVVLVKVKSCTVLSPDKRF